LTFDDIEEATCISEENHRQFLDVFTTFGRKHLFPKWVVAPKNCRNPTIKQTGY
jgi:hypothetical protein